MTTPAPKPPPRVHLTAAEMIAMAVKWSGSQHNADIQRLVAEVFRLRAKLRTQRGTK